MFYNFIKALIISLIIIPSTFSQDSGEIRSVGLTASFTGIQLDFLVPIRFTRTFTLEPGIGVIHRDKSGTDFHISLAPKFYLSSNSKVLPFLGGRFAVLLFSPDDDDMVNDYIIGLIGGGEYYFDSQFCVGIETQLNISIANEKSLRFGNPESTNINTAVALFASIYF